MSQMSYQRAMTLVTASSMLVPVIGLATAPILTHSLGIAGRGSAGAAMAPNLLIVGGATLGLPQALVYVLAKSPLLTRVALLWACAVSLVIGIAALVGVAVGGTYLSDGDADLAHLMFVGAVLALPALVVGLLRGAATGRQLWASVALERTVNSVLRLLALSILGASGKLTVASAIFVMCGAPVVAGLVYLPLLKRPDDDGDTPQPSGKVLPRLVGFGAQVWLGSVATMLMARLSQLLVTPLSTVEQLGLLIVAITISDVPYIVSQTVREVSFGVNSAEGNLPRLLTTSRVATLVAVVGSLVLGGTLPLWIARVFGPGFDAAIIPTWLLLGASCVAVPGLIAGAGLDSVGRPSLRSGALVTALLANFCGLLALTPHFGASGAALAALVSSLASTVFLVVAARRVLVTPASAFFVPKGADVLFIKMLITRMLLSVSKRSAKGN